MIRTLKIVHITDLHLRAAPAAYLHGWPVEQAWRRVADDAMARHPDADAWVLGGDLVDDDSVAGYQRLNRQLAVLPCPIIAIAGNHDDPVAMARHLLCASVHQPVTVVGWRIYALNSHIDGSDAGRVGTQQLATLRQQLQANTAPSVICIHHPPLVVGSAWLDAIGLHDRAALCALLQDYPHVAAVLCGHAHQALATEVGQARCWITPSTMRQFRPGADDFALDAQAAPGYRVVFLHANGRASSMLQRLPVPGI